MAMQGKDHVGADAFGEGDIGAVAKLKDAATGDLLLDKEIDVEPPRFDFPEPVMSFAITPKAKGEEEKLGQALRRLTEEDRTLTCAATRRPASSSSPGCRRCTSRSRSTG